MNAATRRIKGTKVEFREVNGPTFERLVKADGHFAVGDDKRGGKLYHFCDTPLDRLFSRLIKRAGKVQEEELRVAYAGLLRYRDHWQRAGKEPSISSVDPNRVYSPDPSRRSGMPMAESQVYHDSEWRSGRKVLNHRQGIVVDNVVCYEHPLDIAGFAVGQTNKPQAVTSAEELLRASGERLAAHWGIG